jgi:two-component system LytT family response regulator
MSRTAAALPAGTYLRIHRSAIVRLAQVRELVARPNRELDVLLRDGTRLRASRRYAERLREALGLTAPTAPTRS